jgi:hypothetical protein
MKDYAANPFLFLAPLSKYWEKGCCEDPRHMPGRKEDGFKKNLELAVYQARVNIKNFAFRAGIRNSATFSTWGAVKKTNLAWADPVHLVESCNVTLAETIMEAVEDLGKKRKSNKMPCDSTPQKKLKMAAQTDTQQQRAAGGGRGGDHRVLHRGMGPRGHGGRGGRGRRGESWPPSMGGWSWRGHAPGYYRN